jgi:hypothetical protein
MRGQTVMALLVFFIFGQPLFGPGHVWPLRRLWLSLIGLAMCVGGLRMVLPCLLRASAEEARR